MSYGYMDQGIFVPVSKSQSEAQKAAKDSGCNLVGYTSKVNKMFMPTSKYTSERWSTYYG